MLSTPPAFNLSQNQTLQLVIGETTSLSGHDSNRLIFYSPDSLFTFQGTEKQAARFRRGEEALCPASPSLSTAFRNFFSMASRTCLSKIVRLVGQAAVLVAEEPSRPFHAPPSTTFCNNFAFSRVGAWETVGAQRVEHG